VGASVATHVFIDSIVPANSGVKVFVDPKAVMFLIGAHMDFVEDAVKAEFTFVNPNAKGSCGCGESFNV
jgi:iron-sulfur cluster assembly accessory protein